MNRVGSSKKGWQLAADKDREGTVWHILTGSGKVVTPTYRTSAYRTQQKAQDVIDALASVGTAEDWEGADNDLKRRFEQAASAALQRHSQMGESKMNRIERLVEGLVEDVFGDDAVGRSASEVLWDRRADLRGSDRDPANLFKAAVAILAKVGVEIADYKNRQYLGAIGMKSTTFPLKDSPSKLRVYWTRKQLPNRVSFGTMGSAGMGVSGDATHTYTSAVGIDPR